MILGNFVPYIIKTLRGDAHSREDVRCRKRPRSARECAKAHSLSFQKGVWDNDGLSKQ